MTIVFFAPLNNSVEHMLRDCV